MSGLAQRHTFDGTPGSVHELVVGLVPPRSRVLELGCATGYMSQVLQQRLGCTVTGVELSPQAAARASAHCQRVLVGNLETLALARELTGERFDAAVCADVLEHLRDPGALLERLVPLLAEGAAVVASIPNVAHASVRLALLGGEFRYGETGLLDRTHLRFFTRESIEDLFEGAGYGITHWLRRRLGIEQSEVAPPLRPVPEAVRDWLAGDPEASTYQFVVRAVPSPDAAGTYRRRAQLREAQAADQWVQRARRAAGELSSVVGADAPFILVDEDRIRSSLPEPVRAQAWPFPQSAGQYGGPPADGGAAVAALERARQRGAAFAVIAWPAFWWLDHYPSLAQHLETGGRRVLETDRVIVFDLRPARG